MDRLSKAFVAIAAIGIPDALYHAYDEITSYSSSISTICNTHVSFWGILLSCGSVFKSGYTRFPPGYGPAMWVYGVVWFPLILALGLWFARKSGTLNGTLLLPVLMVGNVFTLYLWYLELGVIHAICPVCVSLYALNYVMTGLAAWSLVQA